MKLLWHYNVDKVYEKSSDTEHNIITLSLSYM